MFIVVLISVKNGREANKIAKKLVEAKLIACANIVRDIKSIFSWKGKLEKADEVLLILKSQKRCFPGIVKTVKKLHSYDVPEIIALPIIDGNKDYLKWVGENATARVSKK